MDPSDFEGRHFNFSRIATGSPLPGTDKSSHEFTRKSNHGARALAQDGNFHLRFKVHDAVLHHEVDLLQLLHVGDGISGHGDDVSELTRLD